MSKAVLQGQFTDTELTDLQQLFLKHYKMAPIKKYVGKKNTRDMWKGKVAAWHESTTTSLSSCQLGHFKALIWCFEEDLNTDERKIMYQKQIDVINTHIILLNYAQDYWYPFKCWQNIVKIVIAKLIGCDKIHLICIFHLFEADYSLFLGLKWQELVATAEQRGLLNQGLYGGRKGYDTKTLLLIEELKYDISYSSRKSLINVDNDAALCYDRILPNISSLVAQKFGLNKNVTFVHATTLEQAKYCLKTALGVSDEYYQHCGQGTTNSPQTWLIISSTLCGMFEEPSHGTTFVSPDQVHQVLLTILGFVNNKNNQVNEFCNNDMTIERLLSLIQKDSQLWSKLLWLSAGLLELTKCSYYILHFNFKPDSSPEVNNTPQVQPLRIKNDNTDDYTNIQYKSAFNPHKTLGHYKACAGNSKTQYIVLKNKAKKYACKVLKSSLTHHESWVYYSSCHLKSLGYVLGQTFFSKTLLEDIDQPDIHAFTSKCGYNRNMAYAIQDGPSNLGGSKFTLLYHLQDIQQIQNFVCHFCNLLIPSIYYTSPLCGCSTNLGGKHHFSRTPHLFSHMLNLNGFHLFVDILEPTVFLSPLIYRCLSSSKGE
eukprot:6512629-Ditylum_brightwellii.AAC.1